MTAPSGRVGLREIAREWTRIGAVGFGGPPAHMSLLHGLCVERRHCLSDGDFSRAVAASNILPGPSSTQLAIYLGWRLRGRPGAVVAGLGFILPGLALMIGLSAVFLAGATPKLIRAVGMGAGAAVAAVAVRAGITIARGSLSAGRGTPHRVAGAYLAAGALAAALTGAWLVVVILGCGLLELVRRRLARAPSLVLSWPGVLASAAPAGLGALAWTALKVGALSFGGGFVIVPLMQADAVGNYHWMTHGQFLTAVALGQVTPGPLVQTVAAVGYAAGGVPAALLAAAVAFAPSFSFVMIGATRYESLLADERAGTFIAGAAPAAAGAIVGAAVPLAGAIAEPWQAGVLAGATVALFALRWSAVRTLLLAGAAGAVALLAGAPLG